MAPMPLKKLGMGPEFRIRRRKGFACRIDQFPDLLRVICLTRDENIEIVTQADKPTVKHPVNGSREGDTISHRVRPMARDRFDMRRFNFGATASIN